MSSLVRNRWAITLVLYFASVVVVINQFKVPPVLSILMEQLHVGMAAAGWLMSIFALAGVMLALPAALILNRLGFKGSGLLGLGCTILGSFVGGLAKDSTSLLLGRAVEGVGLGIIGVVAPALLAALFSPQEVSLPMGVWATWVPVGSTIAYNVATPLESIVGWRGIWWLGVILGLVAFVAYGLAVPQKLGSADAKSNQGNAGKGWKTPVFWLLAVGFFAFMVSCVGYATWAPSYYNQFFGLDARIANLYASLLFLVSILGNVGAGWLLAKADRRAVLLGLFIIMSVLYPLGFRLASPDLILPYVIAVGAIGGCIPTAIFTLASEVAPVPGLHGIAMSIVNLGQNMGSLTGPPIVGLAVTSASDWVQGSYPLLATMLLGVIASIVLLRFRTKEELV